MLHSRVRARGRLLLCLVLLGLCGGRAAAVVILDDGGTHLINGPSDPVRVYDSLSGATTTLIIDDPAQISAYGLGYTPSVLAEASHGGKAVVKLLGGTLDNFLEALDNSCVTISGGSIGSSPGAGDLSVRAKGTSGLAAVGISGGTFSGTLDVGSNSRVTVSAGSFGADLYGLCVRVVGTSGTAFADISGGTFSGMLAAHENSRVTVSGGSFGGDMHYHSVSAYAPSGGTAVVDISNTGFMGALRAATGAQVSISAGWFGAEADHLSVVAHAPSGAPAVVDIASGVFTGAAVANSNGRLRIGGGLFGATAPSYETPVPVSVWASGVSGVAQVFGGTFSGAFRAGGNGTIHVYGQGLSISGPSNLLTGTLADGSPISAETITLDNGQIVLHDIAQILSIPSGFSLMQTQGPSTFWLPASVLPPPDGCPFGAVPVLMQGAPLGVSRIGGRLLDLLTTDTIIERMAEATNPGGGRFEDTIPIELVAMQLMSVEPIGLEPLGGTGSDHLFLTLQSDRAPGPGGAAAAPSTGEMTIDFAMRTLEWTLDVAFDVRAGSPDGPILFSVTDTIHASAPWAPEPPGDALRIPGINDALFAGVVGGSLVGFNQEGQFLRLRSSSVAIPEPSSLVLLGLGGLAARRRRRRSRAAGVRS